MFTLRNQPWAFLKFTAKSTDRICIKWGLERCLQLQIGLKVHRFGKSDLAAQLWITSMLAPSGPAFSTSDAFATLEVFFIKMSHFIRKKQMYLHFIISRATSINIGQILVMQTAEITCNPLFEQLSSFLRKRSSWFAWSKKSWNQSGIKNYTRYLKKLFCAHFSFGIWKYLNNDWNLLGFASHGYIYNLFSYLRSFQKINPLNPQALAARCPSPGVSRPAYHGRILGSLLL